MQPDTPHPTQHSSQWHASAPAGDHMHVLNDRTPLQSEIDAAYSVKIFLDYHPGRHRSIAILAHQSGLSEERLQAAFIWVFNESLEQYWSKMQWRSLAGK